MNTMYGYIPFLDKADILRKENIAIDPMSVFFPFEIADEPALLAQMEEMGDAVFKLRLPVVYQVEPLGIKVLMESPIRLFWYRQHKTPIPCVLLTVDYSTITPDIKVEPYVHDTRGKVNVASLQTSTLHSDLHLLYTDVMLKRAIAGGVATQDDINSLPKITLHANNPENIQEASSGDEFKKITENITEDLVLTKELSSFGEYLRRLVVSDSAEAVVAKFLSGNFTKAKPPHLVGPTAVAKSALVLESANALGYRVVDIRTTYLERMDIFGLVNSIKPTLRSGYERLNELATHYKFVSSSDNFVEYAKACVPLLEEELSTMSSGDSKYAVTQKLLEQYREYSKPVVLFFDEFLRGDAAIKEALIGFISGGKLRSLTFKQTKMVFASNLPIDTLADPRYSNYEAELRSIYTIGDMMGGWSGAADPALPSRFDNVLVFPKDLLPRWFAWAKKTPSKPDSRKGVRESNIHPSIIKFLEANMTDVYDMALPMDALMGGMKQYRETTISAEDLLKLTPFPNYRSWTNTSDYIYTCLEKDLPVNVSVIEGYLNKPVTTRLIKYLQPILKFKLLDISVDDDDFDAFVASAIPAAQNIILLGPTGLGKSTRIEEFCADPANNTVEIQVPLNAMAKGDVAGNMGKCTPLEAALRGIGRESDAPQDFIQRAADIARSYKLPEVVSINEPDAPFAEELNAAIDGKKNVVLFFDEFNRVGDPAMIAATFEAISDERVFGYAFGDKAREAGINVTSVLAGNLVGGFDPATLARGSARVVFDYPKGYPKSVRNYLRNRPDTYAVEVVAWLDTLPDDILLGYLASIQESEYHTNMPSTRGFTAVAEELHSKHARQGTHLYGSILFTINAGLISNLDPARDTFLDDVRTIVNPIMKYLKNWAPLYDLNNCVTLEGVSNNADAEDLVSALKTFYNAFFGSNPITRQSVSDAVYNERLQMFKNILGSMTRLEGSVTDRRRILLTGSMGPEVGNALVDYYNAVSGRGDKIIGIEELDVFENISIYVNQQLPIMGASTTEEIITAWVAMMQEVMAFWGKPNPLPPGHYREFISQLRGYLQDGAAMRLVLARFLTGPGSAGYKWAGMMEGGQLENSLDYVVKNILGWGNAVSIDKLERGVELIRAGLIKTPEELVNTPVDSTSDFPSTRPAPKVLK